MACVRNILFALSRTVGSATAKFLGALVAGSASKDASPAPRFCCVSSAEVKEVQLLVGLSLKPLHRVKVSFSERSPKGGSFFRTGLPTPLILKPGGSYPVSKDIQVDIHYKTFRNFS